MREFSYSAISIDKFEQAQGNLKVFVQYEEVIKSDIEVGAGSEWVGCRLLVCASRGWGGGVVSLVAFSPRSAYRHFLTLHEPHRWHATT